MGKSKKAVERRALLQLANALKDLTGEAMQAAVANGFNKGLIVSSKELFKAGLSFPCRKKEELNLNPHLQGNITKAQDAVAAIITGEKDMTEDTLVMKHDIHAHVNEKSLLYGTPLLLGIPQELSLMMTGIKPP